MLGSTYVSTPSPVLLAAPRLAKFLRRASTRAKLHHASLLLESGLTSPRIWSKRARVVTCFIFPYPWGIAARKRKICVFACSRTLGTPSAVGCGAPRLAKFLLRALAGENFAILRCSSPRIWSKCARVVTCFIFPYPWGIASPKRHTVAFWLAHLRDPFFRLYDNTPRLGQRRPRPSGEVAA